MKLCQATTNSISIAVLLLFCVQTKADQSPCIFPFTFNSKVYLACTRDGRDDKRLWCAATSNYDKDSLWKFCDETLKNDQKHLDTSKSCVFPFTFNNKAYVACTRDGRDDKRLWCATTSNYDTDSQWKFCDETPENVHLTTVAASIRSKMTISGQCVIPFTFNSKQYLACTRDGRDDKLLWCATTSNYDKDTQWKFCDETPTNVHPNQLIVASQSSSEAFSSLEECISRCNLMPQCLSISFDLAKRFSNNCFLSTGPMKDYRSQEDWISWFKPKEKPSHSLILAHMRLLHSPYKLMQTTSAHNCARQCQESLDCIGMSFESSAEDCYLMTGKQSIDIVDQYGWETYIK